eukprot:m.92266 g.92266  ORF g.92266 m.92266 type:complete len:57 (+) comp13342_c0_seq4:197-367(+)
MAIDLLDGCVQEGDIVHFGVASDKNTPLVPFLYPFVLNITLSRFVFVLEYSQNRVS